jgi:VWFA-related protein
MVRTRLVISLIVGFSLTAGGFSTTTLPQEAKTQVEKQSQQKDEKQEAEAVALESQLVLLDALVVNKETTRPVGNLKAEDFLLSEDGVMQKITHFSQDLLPLSVLLLIDVSGSVRPMMHDIHRAALDALSKLKENDEVALMVFATGAKLVVGFTQNHALVAEKINEVETIRDVGGATFINNAMAEAAEYMRSATKTTDRRVIIGISDDIDMSVPFKGRSQSDASNLLYESGIAVCGLIVGGGLHKVMRTYNKAHPAIFLWRKLTRAGSFKGYADKTGGMVVSSRREEISQVFRDLIEVLRARYTIGYSPSNTTHDGKFRKIKLRLAKSAQPKGTEVAVVTRRGYYAKKQTPSAPPSK